MPGYIRLGLEITKSLVKLFYHLRRKHFIYPAKQFESTYSRKIGNNKKPSYCATLIQVLRPHLISCIRAFRKTASNSSVPTLEIFARPQARKNACWGAPQTRRTSGQSVPKSRRDAPVVCGLSLPLLGLIFPPVRHAEQMVNVGLDRHGLPHIGLGLAVLGIEGLFLFRELPA